MKRQELKEPLERSTTTRGERCGSWADMDTGLSAAACSTGRPLPVLPPGFDAADRAVLMDFIVGLSVTLQLTDYSLHLASAVIDKYLSLQEGPVGPDRIQIIGATCLKVADVFAEPSKEYYKQENAVEYSLLCSLNTSATFRHVAPMTWRR